jgi:hypothetical protein
VALPVAPPPLAGELLGSWLSRLAALYDAPPQYLWNTLAGLPASGFVWDGRVPWPEQVSRVAAAARLDLRVLAATNIEAMLPGAPAAWLRARLASAVRVPWCSACLRDDLTRGRSPYLRRLWAAACVAVCPRHRVPLVDICGRCGSTASPAFRWAGRRSLMLCGHCGEPLSARVRADTGISGDFNAAVAATGQLQPMLLRALRGYGIASLQGGKVVFPGLVQIVERLVAVLLFPLGIAKRPALAISGADSASHPFNGLRAEEAFAVLAAVAAILARPRGMSTREATSLRDLRQLWGSPIGGGAVLCGDDPDLLTIAGIGAAVALTLRQDPEIAALMAVRPSSVAPSHREGARRHPAAARREPAETDRWNAVAREILADPKTMARVAKAGSPKRRRRLLGRLARVALASQGWRCSVELAAIP